MMTGALLLGYALVVATGGAWLMERARWPRRAPRAGIVVWQALSASMLGAVLLAGLSIAMPMLPFTVNIAEFLHTCAMLLRLQYATPVGAIATSSGLALVVLVASRVAWCALCTWRRVARARHAQRQHLAVLARRDDATGILVLDHACAAAYCLPGRGGQVVLTAGALAQLEADELRAVLAHERAHLCGRHDLVIATATALRDAFPFVPLFAAAARHVPGLVEMAADDVALRSADRASLARALLSLVGAPTPAGLLGAGGATAVDRVRRLVSPERPIRPVQALAVVAVVGIALTVPLVVAAAPALAVAGDAYCPVATPL